MEPLAFSKFCFSSYFCRVYFKDLLPGTARTKYAQIVPSEKLFLRYQAVVEFIHEMHISFYQLALLPKP